VQLPVASSSSEQDRSNYVSINVSEQGEYYLDKEPVTYEMLRARLLELKASRPEIKIFISSDGQGTVPECRYSAG